jgi:hypothetical protein
MLDLSVQTREFNDAVNRYVLALGKVDGTNRVVMNVLTTAYVKPLGTAGTL